MAEGVMVERFYCGEAPRQVTVREGDERQPLDPRFDLRKHSSAGLAWGDGSAEAAHQLALALLADALRDDARAIGVHLDFSRRVVPLFPARWTITRSRILAYANTIEAERNLMLSDMRPNYASPSHCVN
jgi:hypothetical protein